MRITEKQFPLDLSELFDTWTDAQREEFLCRLAAIYQSHFGSAAWTQILEGLMRTCWMIPMLPAKVPCELPYPEGKS